MLQLTSPISRRTYHIALAALSLLVLKGSPASAQTVLFEETFTGTTVANPAAFSFGVGASPGGVGAVSHPPCLTAATTVANPPLAGNGVGIPACRTTTTNSGPLGAPGVLRLTPSLNSTDTERQQSAFVVTNASVPASQGLTITFDLFAYNAGTPLPPGPNPPGADGISFFLLDASQPVPTAAGGFGGSLGYANRTAGVPPVTLNGIQGGYVGIGFDEFGNFSRNNENRNGGFPALVPDSVGIRGSQGTNYRYLGGTGTLAGGIDAPAAVTRAAARRQARILISPNSEVIVQIDFGAGFQTVIPTFSLRSAPGIGGENIDNGALPASFRFGFASSTGSRKNIHEIQSFRVTTLAPPDLNIQKIAPANLTAGTNGTYTLRVRNGTGPNDNVGFTTGPITVVDTLPPGISFVSAVGGAGGNAWNCSASGQIVTCTYSGISLGPGDFAPDITLTVTPTAIASNPVVNFAQTSTPGEVNTANNTATTNTPLTAPQLAARKDIQDLGNGNNVAEAGETLRYTITIQNTGNAPSTNTTLTDAIPTNTTYVANSTQLNGAPVADVAGTMPFSGGALVNSPGQPVGTIAAGNQATIVFDVTVNNPIPSGVTQIANQGSVNSAELPPVPPIQTNIAVLPTGPGPSLVLIKRIVQAVRGGITFNFQTAEGNPPEPSFVGTANLAFQLSAGDRVTYRIYYLSNGSATAQNVQLCDPIPASTSYALNTLRFANPQNPPANPNTPLASAAQTDATDGDTARFVPALTIPGGACGASTNPNGSTATGAVNVPRTQVGFLEFSTTVP